MADVYAEHKAKVDALQREGYHVKVQWKCQWPGFLQQNPPAQDFLKDHPVPPLLDPRDAFNRGRTNAYQLYRSVTGDEQIHYYDFKSLYPYVNKYSVYPLGHPVIIT